MQRAQGQKVILDLTCTRPVARELRGLSRMYVCTCAARRLTFSFSVVSWSDPSSQLIAFSWRRTSLLAKWSGMPNRRSTTHSSFRFTVSHSYTRSTYSLCLAQPRSFSLQSFPVSVGRGSSRRANRASAPSAKTDNEALPGTYETPDSDRGGRSVLPVRTGHCTDTTGRTDRTTNRTP